MHTDIGAAVNGDNAIPRMAALAAQQSQHKGHFLRIEAAVIEQLKSNAVTAVVINHPVIIAIDDQTAVVSRGKDEGERALGCVHASIRSESGKRAA
jgi:hypothetical protein